MLSWETTFSVNWSAYRVTNIITQPYIRGVVTNLVVVVVEDAPFLCLTAPPPPARGEEPVRGEPAPTFVLLAAGPTNIKIN